jgi:hypothetical protein
MRSTYRRTPAAADTLPSVGDFKRSARFGIAGVIAVGALTVLIGLTLGSGSDPTLAMALILGIVFAFVGALLMLQRRDLDAAEAKSKHDALLSATPVTDPTTADDASLLAALAIKPIDPAAISEQRRWLYGIGRESISSGAKLMVLIFCAVVPWQLFQFIWSIVIFVPIIVIYASYLAAKAIGGGGTLDQAYEGSAASLDPLGLQLVERPQVEIGPRPVGPGMQKHVTGAVVYTGTRHGRAVWVRLEGGAVTYLGGSYPEFEIQVKGERLRATDGAPSAVAAVVEPLRPSSWWKGVEVRGGADGITVERKRAGAQHWMRDLWLAERVAAAAG